MKLRTFLLTVGVALFGLLPTVALAAPDVHATPVDLRPLLQEVLLIVASIVSMLAVWALRALAAYIRTKTGVNIMTQEALIRQYIESALQSGLKYASTQVDRAAWAQPETKNAMLAIAADYVLDAVPDALAYFKLDRDSIVTRLQARLPDLEAAVATPAKRK